MIKRLLVVDDEEDLRTALIDALSREDLEVLGAANGVEAHELIKTQEFHAILCDINMPKKNGLELLEELREEGNILPFVILSAFTDRESTLSALRLGAFDYIDKPFELDQLIKTLDQAIEVGEQIKFWKSEPEAMKNLEGLKKETANLAIRSIEKIMKSQSTTKSGKNE